MTRHEYTFRITSPLWGKPPITMDSLYKGLVMPIFKIFFDISLNKLLKVELLVTWDTMPLSWRRYNALASLRSAT